jgi:hypothetical protein
MADADENKEAADAATDSAKLAWRQFETTQSAVVEASARCDVGVYRYLGRFSKSNRIRHLES